MHHDGLLVVSCQFLLSLFGIFEFVSDISSGIEPLHKNRGPSDFRPCQRYGSIIRGIWTLGCNREKRSVQNSAVRTEDLNNIWFGAMVGQFKQIGSRG